MPETANNPTQPARKPGRPKGAVSRPREVTCHICGGQFVTRHSMGRYCSPECTRKGARRSWVKYRDKTEKPPEQRAAHNAVNLEIKMGRLTPQPCSRCGTSPADAHHEDYSKPLDLTWLCRRHHIERHHELEEQNHEHAQ